MNKYNNEGYPDPTAAVTLGNVARDEWANGSKPCVFVCSPYNGDVKRNTQNTMRYMKYEIRKGAIPFAPHLLYPLILNDNEPSQRKLGLSFGLVWLGMCDELWVFGGYVSSEMQSEIDS